MLLPNQNTIDMCSRIMRKATLLASLLMLWLAFSPEASANEDMHRNFRNRYVLVINSYNENAPWSQGVFKPVSEFVLSVDSMFCETVHMNCSTIADTTQYNSTVNRIFRRFEGTTPRCVVMIGSMAFTLRDRIKETWGDIPMLLISRMETYAPVDFYFSDHKGVEDWENLPSLTELRKDYNFSMILVPDLFRQTINLMTSVMPEMKRLVFLADHAWINRVLDSKIADFMKDEYPEMKYEWVQACDSTNAVYQDFLGTPSKENGLLMSTWSYPNSEEELGYHSMVNDNTLLVQSSVNPVFCLRGAYMDIGAVGGVFNSREALAREVDDMMSKMIQGADMRKEPFKYTYDSGIPRINYPLAKEYGLDLKNAPKNTVYIDKPESFWSKYRFGVIIFALALIAAAFIAYAYVKTATRRAMMLRKHESFIKNMPWAYSKAHIIYDGKGEIADIEYDLNDMNAAFLKILETNLLPDKKWKIFPFDFIAGKTKELIKTGKSVSFTYHFEKTDTYYDFLLCRIDPAQLKTGETPQSIDIFANDITALSKADLRLNQTSQKLDMTLQVSRIVPWQWNLDKHIITCETYRINRSVQSVEHQVKERSFTVSEEEFFKFVHPDDLEMVKQLVNDFHTGKLKQHEAQFRMRLGREGHLRNEWIEVNAALTGHDNGAPARIVIGSMLVITERKKQEFALIEAKERAAESDKLKSAFLANMSHEIRTPLNAIIGFSNMLSQTKDERKQRKFINIIEHNNQLLLHLVNEVLDLAKIESNTLEFNLVLTDLNDLMDQVKETVRLRVPQGVMFNMVLGSAQCMINTDSNRLSQVLINLLTNATKFTTKGSISFGYEEQGDELYFYVTDTGIGISKENIKKLFNRFSKLNNFAQGTGLGLAISKSIIAKLGGQIGAKSRGEGKGTTFWFTLPFESVEKPVEVEAKEVPVEEVEQEIDGDNVTILVAEDNPSNYILFESILSEKFKLLHAVDGEEAVAMHKEHKPNLILMDIGMPKMDGMEATAEIRKTDTKTPIIAVTAFAFSSEKKKILKSGFNDYVPKPVNPHDLLESIARALNKVHV